MWLSESLLRACSMLLLSMPALSQEPPTPQAPAQLLYPYSRPWLFLISFDAHLYLSLQQILWHTTRNHIQVTCYHAWNDEREDDELQHSHEDLSWEAKVLLVELGEGRVLSDHDAQTDAWTVGRRKSIHKEIYSVKSLDHRTDSNIMAAYSVCVAQALQNLLCITSCPCHIISQVREVSPTQNSWGTTHTDLQFPPVNLTCISLNDRHINAATYRQWKSPNHRTCVPPAGSECCLSLCMLCLVTERRRKIWKTGRDEARDLCRWLIICAWFSVIPCSHLPLHVVSFDTQAKRWTSGNCQHSNR